MQAIHTDFPDWIGCLGEQNSHGEAHSWYFNLGRLGAVTLMRHDGLLNVISPSVVLHHLYLPWAARKSIHRRHFLEL